MSKSVGLNIILLLALVQGGFGLLRAYNWVQIGTDLFGQGLLLLLVWFDRSYPQLAPRSECLIPRSRANTSPSLVRDSNNSINLYLFTKGT